MLIFLAVITACNPASKYKKEIAEIDSSLAVVDSIEQKYNGIEFDSLRMMVDHVLMNEDSIKEYYHPDTLSLYIGIRMNDSKGIRKSLRSIDSKKQNFAEEIATLRLQLKNLKTDIENGVLKEEKIKEYLAKEKEDLNILNLSFNDFYTIQEKQKRYYYSSVPVIDSFLVVLKNEAQED